WKPTSTARIALPTCSTQTLHRWPRSSRFGYCAKGSVAPDYRRGRFTFSSRERSFLEDSDMKIFGIAFPILFLSLFFAAQPSEHSNATEGTSRSAPLSIPAGTILPVSLPGISSRKNRAGDLIKAHIAQDVPLAGGETIRSGTVVIGHVVRVVLASS